MLAQPSSAQAYHAAFPDFSGPEDKVTKGRIGSFEHDDAGRVPFIRLMARSGFGIAPARSRLHRP